MTRTYSRRQFIKSLVALTAGTLTARCRAIPSTPTADSVDLLGTVLPKETIPIPGESSKRLYTVALSKANDYGRELVRQRMETMLNGIGVSLMW